MGAFGNTVRRSAPRASRLERLERWALRHWLALLNTAAAIFAGLPMVAPALLAIGWTGTRPPDLRRLWDDLPPMAGS